MTPLTELPDDDAPFSEWCRPISATMVNKRAATTSSMAEPGQRGAGRDGKNWTTLASLRKRLKARGLLK